MDVPAVQRDGQCEGKQQEGCATASSGPNEARGSVGMQSHHQRGRVAAREAERKQEGRACATVSMAQSDEWRGGEGKGEESEDVPQRCSKSSCVQNPWNQRCVKERWDRKKKRPRRVEAKQREMTEDQDKRVGGKECRVVSRRVMS